jgi:hypothetical protein
VGPPPEYEIPPTGALDAAPDEPDPFDDINSAIIERVTDGDAGADAARHDAALDGADIVEGADSGASGATRH